MLEVNDRPTFHLTPGYGEAARDLLGYSQAVRIGNRVETSGQGGWDDAFAVPQDLEAEIVAAFDNVARTLAEAGATWADVVHVNSYHRVAPGEAAIGADHNDVMTREFRVRTGGRAPVWTQTGVTALGLAAMRVEIRVTALIEPERTGRD
ncbi:Rid family hydrolase [Pseudonocardia sp. ICBG1293]|uniref:Rid family hydrolase n=1 Tax=Pseudonocardia sp. ICBG1293 TaxID=2844382 RepID=UPI001CCBAA17|nr:Rid family hydrolase [Pseudonocardia sp. ICBG1293]